MFMRGHGYQDFVGDAPGLRFRLTAAWVDVREGVRLIFPPPGL